MVFSLIKTMSINNCDWFSENDLEKLLESVILASKHGISALKNSTNELNWSFGQSLFFSTTVITTIGYGHVSPISDGGKIFCIVYAIIGIPFILTLLSASVERLMGVTNWILGLLNRKLGHLYQPFNIRILHLVIIGKAHCGNCSEIMKMTLYVLFFYTKAIYKTLK